VRILSKTGVVGVCTSGVWGRDLVRGECVEILGGGGWGRGVGVRPRGRCSGLGGRKRSLERRSNEPERKGKRNGSPRHAEAGIPKVGGAGGKGDAPGNRGQNIAGSEKRGRVGGEGPGAGRAGTADVVGRMYRWDLGWGSWKETWRLFVLCPPRIGTPHEGNQARVRQGGSCRRKLKKEARALP